MVKDPGKRIDQYTCHSITHDVYLEFQTIVSPDWILPVILHDQTSWDSLTREKCNIVYMHYLSMVDGVARICTCYTTGLAYCYKTNTIGYRNDMQESVQIHVLHLMFLNRLLYWYFERSQQKGKKYWHGYVITVNPVPH